MKADLERSAFSVPDLQVSFKLASMVTGHLLSRHLIFLFPHPMTMLCNGIPES
jgi:hypothetical protein